MEKCYKCGSKTDLSILTIKSKKSGKIYKYARCRPCNTKRLREYRKTDSGAAAVRRAVSAYDQKNKLRRDAWTAARSLGTRPCEKCGVTENVHKHHPRPDRPMEVIWLCALHHKEEHGRGILKKK